MYAWTDRNEYAFKLITLLQNKGEKGDLFLEQTFKGGKY